MQIWKIITLSNDFMEFSNSFYLIPKIETDSKKWSQMTILMLFYSYRRCTSSKIGKRKMSKIQIFENKAWKCGGPWGFFLQRFFKHFQYVPILAQMSTSAEAAVEFLPKNVENGFFFGKVFEVKSVCSSPAAKNPVGWFEPEGPEEVLLAHISQK